MSVREEDVIALRNEIHRLEMLVEGMAEAAEEITSERDELRCFVVAHTRREMFIGDFDHHDEIVNEFHRAAELPAVKAVIAATLLRGGAGPA